MEKVYDTVKSGIVNFKLNRCCCFAPIRIGLLMIGYFNVIIALLSLLETATDGISPPLITAQTQLLEENALAKHVGILAYSIEISFNVLLLSAVYRKDIVLLRVYIYYMIATIVASLLVYSMVIAAVSPLNKLIIIGNMVYNLYLILLVRSVIVEIKENQRADKKNHVVLYSVAPIPQEEKQTPVVQTTEEQKENKVESDKECKVESDKEYKVEIKECKVEIKEETKTDIKEDEVPLKLETVIENPQAEKV